MVDTDEGGSGIDEPFVGQEIQWGQIEGDLFRVMRFTPMATAAGGKVTESVGRMPYGLLKVESPILNQPARIPVNHRDEFLNLWDIYQDGDGMKEGTELLVSYLPYRGFLGFLTRMIQPRLHLRVHPAGELERYYSDESHWERPSARDYFFPKSVVGRYCRHCQSRLYTFVVRCAKCRRPVLD